MNNDNAAQAIVSQWEQLPIFDLSQLPARLSKRLWVSPTEFLILTHALRLAEWALGLARRWRPSLPEVTGGDRR